MESFKLFLEDIREQWQEGINTIIAHLGEILNKDEISDADALTFVNQIPKFLPDKAQNKDEVEHRL